MKKRLVTSDQAEPIERQHRSPCGDCPFARTALPHWLAGQSVGEWLMVAHGDGRMECHTTTINGKPAECAGASIFRANVCKFPTGLKLPRNIRTVFASDAEFASLHLQREITPKEAGELKMEARFNAVL